AVSVSSLVVLMVYPPCEKVSYDENLYHEEVGDVNAGRPEAPDEGSASARRIGARGAREVAVGGGGRRVGPGLDGDRVSLLPDPAGAARRASTRRGGADRRVALVQNALYDLVRDHETEFRLFLQSSVTRALRGSRQERDPLRGARRDALLSAALAPLARELPEEKVDRLKIALAALVGVESMIVFRDVMGLE